jgi:hypothetical protein
METFFGAIALIMFAGWGMIGLCLVSTFLACIVIGIMNLFKYLDKRYNLT